MGILKKILLQAFLLSVRRIRISRGRRHVHWTEVFDLDVPAPPYAKNPSRWSQRIPICVLAGMGAVLAGYMGLFQWEIIETVWDPVFGTGSEEVLTSSVAEQMERWLHIPDSSFGAWAYFSEAILSLMGSTRRWQYRPWIVALFGIDVILLGGISAMLIMAQGFIIGSWCFLCLCNAAISFILIALAYGEVRASFFYMCRVWNRFHDRQLVNRVFWGFSSEKAEAIALRR
jgi:uncharacterized membrane protein